MITGALLAALAGIGGGTATPSVVGAPNATLSDGGACDLGGGGAHDAVVQVSWSINNPDAVNYTVNLYENGSLLASGLSMTSFMTYNKTITGLVETGTDGAGSTTLSAHWTYRVDIVRNSDSVVIQSVSGSEYDQNFAPCTV